MGSRNDKCLISHIFSQKHDKWILSKRLLNSRAKALDPPLISFSKPNFQSSSVEMLHISNFLDTEASLNQMYSMNKGLLESEPSKN